MGFDEWYAQRFGELVRLATLLVGSPDIARDLTQDAMVRVLRHWNRIGDPDPYARRAVVNACNSHHRRRAMMRRHDEMGTVGAIGAIGTVGVHDPHDAESRALDDAILTALRALSERQRTVIVLRYWSDLPEQEIADMVGLRRSSVASLLHRGLAELRKAVPT